MGDIFRVWTIEIIPHSILKYTTIVTLLGYLILLIYCSVVYEKEHDSLPSISSMIAYSNGTAITFTLLVLIHWYSNLAYLVIASEYIGLRSLQFKIISLCIVIYSLCLLMISYIPVDDDTNPHNVTAVVSFTFAILSVYLHKHTFVVYEIGEWPRFNFRIVDKSLIFSELLIMITLTVLGVLFWFYDYVISEYISIVVILLDKYLKVLILEKSKLLNIEGAKVAYSYYSPNNHQTPIYEKVSTNKPVSF